MTHRDDDRQKNYYVNGRPLRTAGEMVLTDQRGEGVVVLLGIVEDEGQEPAYVVATASVFRPDLVDKIRGADEGGSVDLPSAVFAAETFAVMPMDVAVGIYREDLLAALAGVPCGECEACLEDEAREAGEQ